MVGVKGCGTNLGRHVSFVEVPHVAALVALGGLVPAHTRCQHLSIATGTAVPHATDACRLWCTP
jgi:hypothetical protein